MTYPTEIVKSSVSVYEIELDLNEWPQNRTDLAEGFYEKLVETLPSLQEHKCMSGKAGGFFSEVRKGTNFAHVIEHILLELIHLADSEKRIFTGWTREVARRSNRFIVHYGAPDFLTGRLAAILSVGLVKKMLDGEPVDVNHSLELLKRPLDYFTPERRVKSFTLSEEPLVSVIMDLETPKPLAQAQPKTLKLSRKQTAIISSVLTDIKRHLSYIVESWQSSFLQYSGTFGRLIIDKVGLLNPDRFLDWLSEGDFDRFYRGIRSAGHIIGSYRIPANFIIQSIWLYKSRLLAFIAEEYGDEKPFLDQIIKDFDDFFQILLQNAMAGVQEQTSESITHLGELKKFSEVSERKGMILIVDDDEMVRSACRDMLEYQGFWTVVAHDGTEGLEIFTRKQDEISLVILDSSLPDFSGQEIISRIKGLRRDARVLVMTDYRNGETKKLLSGNHVTLIRKPFSAESLGEKVQSALDRKESRKA